MLKQAAEMLASDRAEVKGRGHAPPGQAEYLDLVRALVVWKRTEQEQLDVMKQLSRFTFQKHPKDRDASP